MIKRTLFILTAALAAGAAYTQTTTPSPRSALSVLSAAAADASATAPTQEPATRLSSTNPSTRYDSSRYDRSSSRRDDRDRSSRGGSSAYPVEKLTGTQYSLLEQRSIFYKGYFRNSDNNRPFTPTTYVSPPSTPPAPPERSLVFEGATSFDDEYVAFIEDFTVGKVQMLKTGDGVAGGKVGLISLTSMDFVNKAGKITHVALGMNLEGGEAPSTRPSYVTAGESTSTGTPGSGTSLTSPSSPSSPGMESIAEKLRRRRMAEMGK